MHPAERLRGEAGNGRLSGKHLLMCVTGSIAAVECVKLIRYLLREGAEVTVTMTDAATRIIHPEALWFASGKRAIVELDGDVQHVTLCGSGESSVNAVLVAPCTANMISKLACGICDDAVSTMLVTAMGSGKPILIAPAMHGDMWNNSIIGNNIEKLVALGVEVISPQVAEGKAKMASLECIVMTVMRCLSPSQLTGRKVTIIGGSTEEPIDSVRVITNRSTGKTAISLAREAFLRGADVELILGRVSERIPDYLYVKRFSTSEELKGLVSGKKFDIVLMPAAVSDYLPAEKIEGKLQSDEEEISLALVRNEKIIDSIDARALVAFKLEAGVSRDQLKERAKTIMGSRKLFAVVANRLEDIEEDRSSVLLIDKSGNDFELSGTRWELASGIFDILLKGLS